MTAVRILDDGAWVSVNDARRVSVSELWRLVDPTFCTCEMPDFAVEGFIEAGTDGRRITARAYGTCIACGTENATGWVPLGRIVDGTFEPYDRTVLDPVTAAET